MDKANVEPSAEEKSPRHTPYVLDLGEPDEMDCGRGVNEARKVIQTLESHGIACCVVGAKALVYYGAHRVPTNWEICVPTNSFDQAKALFTSSPLTEKYELSRPVMPDVGSLMHTYPRFTLKGVNFYFILAPTFEYALDCTPEQCERSPRGIPYPRLEQFTRALLDTQRYADLSDLVDGMNMDEEWGEEHLDLDRAVPIEYIREKNELILRSLDGKPGAVFSLMSETPNARKTWRDIVRTKRKRINAELPGNMYETRFRMVGSKDPRRKKNREV